MQPTITNWNVNPQDVGPMYPLAGWELPMFFACVAFCFGFMVWKFVTENAKYDDRVRHLGQPDLLARAVASDPLHKRFPPPSNLADEEPRNG